MAALNISPLVTQSLRHNKVPDKIVFGRVIKGPTELKLTTAIVYLIADGSKIEVELSAAVADQKPKPGDLVAILFSAADQGLNPLIINLYNVNDEKRLRDSAFKDIKDGKSDELLLPAKIYNPTELSTAGYSLPNVGFRRSKNKNDILKLTFEADTKEGIKVFAPGNKEFKLNGDLVHAQTEDGDIALSLKDKYETPTQKEARIRKQEEDIKNLQTALNFQQANYVNRLIKDDGTINIEVFKKDDNYTLYTDTEVTQAFAKIYTTKSASENKELQAYLKRLREVTKCMEETAKQSKKKTKTFLEQVGDELVNQVLLGVAKEFALTALNSVLPDYLKVNIVIERDENGDVFVKNFSIGQIVYDVREDTVTVGGDIFNPFITSGVDEVNKLLPPFLQVSASELGLEVGDIVIRKNELEQDTQKEYRVRDDIIVVNGNATTYIQMRGQKFNLGRASDIYVDRTISYGLDELNKNLPDLFHVSVSRDPDDDSRVFESGPFTIKASGKNAGLSVDQEKLTQTIEQLPNELLNQVPAPLQGTARALWSQASKYIVDDILYSKATEAKRERERKEKEKATTFVKEQNNLLKRKQALERAEQSLLVDKELLEINKQILKDKKEESYLYSQDSIDKTQKEIDRLTKKIEAEEKRIPEEKLSIQTEEQRLAKIEPDISSELIAQAQQEEASTVAARYDACVATLKSDTPKTKSIAGIGVGAPLVPPGQSPSAPRLSPGTPASSQLASTP